MLTNISAIAEGKLAEEYRAKLENDALAMVSEFDSIPTTTHAACTEAQKQANAQKNRYRNVLPYDDSRVRLWQQPGDPFSDYINASFINGYQQDKEFIAAQGPTIHTVADFWRMIWEQEIPVIVMVTNLKEGVEEKCARYWNDTIGEPFEANDISVTVTKVEKLAEFVIREMNIKNETEVPRTVTQLHFTAWPDFNVPQNPIGMLKFIRRYNAIKKGFHMTTFNRHSRMMGDKPTLIHCSAGVGRTGTFIALDYALKQIEREKQVDIPASVRK